MYATFGLKVQNTLPRYVHYEMCLFTGILMYVFKDVHVFT
jgi:hypothetical protein